MTAEARLPNLDCEVDYHPHFLAPDAADTLLEWFLTNLEKFTNRVAGADGTEITIPPGKCMFVYREAIVAPRLHLVMGRRMVWPEVLLSCKQRVQDLVGPPFTVVLALHYPD